MQRGTAIPRPRRFDHDVRFIAEALEAERCPDARVIRSQQTDMAIAEQALLVETRIQSGQKSHREVGIPGFERFTIAFARQLQYAQPDTRATFFRCCIKRGR